MKYLQDETDFEITLSPETPAVASVILLHGLGADGHDFVPIADEFGLPDSLPVRFVFPHAPMRPVTVNNGYVMRAWYDIKSFTPAGRADIAGTVESSRRVADYIDRERQLGVAPARVVLAGFSQGGAVALYAGLRYPDRLAGILAMSCYLPLPETLAAERSATNSDVPILLCHGRSDPVVPMAMGLEAREELKAHGYAPEWRDYPMQHAVCIEEIADVARWLKLRLAAASGD
ncbi:MAG: dienelactone hydrolase family protein [Steroidobacteraceae bacterium]|jgi:phospholipase/carboxylesterase|nr:dienelactone hydrolase family protein [Pseudomonadota bacterium]MBP7609040.1 dienelactone hydrolase family protein [Steroidobacteraceae bacterium]MBP9129571.1 dienelactone hydrolase family protein [Steroidobacteraceae bacterium]